MSRANFRFAAGNEFGGDITTLSLAQPLNYLAPVVALDCYESLARNELVDVFADEYSFGAGDIYTPDFKLYAV